MKPLLLLTPADTFALLGTVALAILAACVIVAIIKHLRRTPEEKRQAEEARKEQHRLELQQWHEAEQARKEREETEKKTHGATTPTHPLVVWGTVLLLVGVVLFGYGTLVFDTDVKGVNNLGLMLNRLITVLSGLAGTGAGILCLAVNELRTAFTAVQKTE